MTLNTGYWDDHGNIKGRLDDKLPRHDKAVGVLIKDLADRGMLDDTLVVTAGEFGRTPVINKDQGRDTGHSAEYPYCWWRFHRTARSSAVPTRKPSIQHLDRSSQPLQRDHLSHWLEA